MAETTIYAIQATSRHTDPSGERHENTSVVVHEGYFLTEQAAAERIRQLDGSARQMHQHHEEQRLRKHHALVEEADLANREAAAIRAAGMQKEDMPYPKPFEPMSFEQFVQTTPSVVSYQVAPMTRSEFDTSVEDSGAADEKPTA